MGCESLAVLLQRFERVFWIVEQKFAVALIRDTDRGIFGFTFVVGDNGEGIIGGCLSGALDSIPNNSLIRVDLPDE
jgi:hypothetical protein